MKFSSFQELQKNIQDLYQQGEYQAALDLATTQLEDFPERAPLLYYWRICMAARTGQDEMTLNLLDELAQVGFWYNETLLRKSPSLLSLQGQSDFEQRVARNQQLQEADQAQLYPLIILRNEARCGKEGSSCPLLIAMHANASTAQDSVIFWQAAAQEGWLVAIPQSTQAMWKGAYIWDDRPVSEREIHKHYQNMLTHYPVDQQRVVLAGHSTGGEIALWLALSASLPARGVIAFGPAGPLIDDPHSFQELLSTPPTTQLRCYLVYGQEDQTISPKNIQTLAEILVANGIAVEIEDVPDAAHDFIPAYTDSLLRGLDFIVNED